MKPEVPLFLFLSFCFLLRPVTPTCFPRKSSSTYLYLSSPLPDHASASETHSSPSPNPRQFLARSPPTTPASSPSITRTPSPAEEPSPSPVSSPSITPTPSPVRGPSLSPFSSPSATDASTTPSSGRQNAIEWMCGRTDYPGLCLSTISSLLPAFGTVDAKTLLALEMKACQSHTETARTQAAKLATDASTPFSASVLQACTENYDDALDNLDAAAKALADGDQGSLNIMLSALIENYGSCEDGFAEKPGTSPMASYDDALTKLASNCLAMAELIKF